MVCLVICKTQNVEIFIMKKIGILFLGLTFCFGTITVLKASKEKNFLPVIERYFYLDDINDRCKLIDRVEHPERYSDNFTLIRYVFTSGRPDVYHIEQYKIFSCCLWYLKQLLKNDTLRKKYIKNNPLFTKTPKYRMLEITLGIPSWDYPSNIPWDIAFKD